MDKEKKISIVLFVLAIVFTIIGSTFAYWNWQSSVNDKTNVTFTVASDFSCGADGGGSITSQQKSLAPTSCTNTTYAFQRPIVVKPTINAQGKTIYMDLYLKVNQIGQYLSESSNFRYALTTSSSSCTSGVIVQGTFQGTTTNSQVRLLHNKAYSSTTNDQYYLYIWLDAAETNNNTQNQPFDISLGGTCTDEAPTTFTGTIYRYSTEDVSIGQRIALQSKQAWCANSIEFGNSCDFGYFWDTEQECEDYVTEQNMENTTCGEGTVTPISYETNPANLNKTFYLKHTVVDDIVTESYVEFIVTPAMAQANPGMTAGTYTLRGGDSGVSFLANAKIIYDAFGGVGCYSDGTAINTPYSASYSPNPSSNFDCGVSGLGADAYSDGGVGANGGAGAYCGVDSGTSDCSG